LSASEPRSYGASARLLGVGVAATGIVTFAYFALASHALGAQDYAHISVLWAILLPTVSVLYRPVEQLLARTIAGRRARGIEGGHPLRAPLALQGGFALAFLVAAVAFRTPLVDGVFGGSAAFWWILVVAVVAYAASYLARGWLAGHERFGLYGGLVLVESSARCAFAVGVAVGIASGPTAVALGMVAAPVLSLLVVPPALARRRPGRRGGLALREGGAFALGVLGVQLAEQAILNAPVLVVDAVAENPALAGAVFSVLLIARAPLQLFQAVQTALLPHLTKSVASADGQGRRAIRATLGLVAAFAALVVLILLLAGPRLMELAFGPGADYGAGGLAAVGAGMGLHLAAGTLTQSALAHGRAAPAAAAWLFAAALFVAWVASPTMSDPVLRVEVGYLGAAGLLCGLLSGLERRGPSAASIRR
jgi:O-antigen/teichoic acid export membrane protein